MKNKLLLKRETITQLTSDDLEDVNGGGTPAISSKICSAVVTFVAKEVVSWASRQVIKNIKEDNVGKTYKASRGCATKWH